MILRIDTLSKTKYLYPVPQSEKMFLPDDRYTAVQGSHDPDPWQALFPRKSI